MYLLGTIIILIAIAAALLASVSYGLVTRGNTAMLPYGRIGTRVALGAVLAVVALLAYLFVNQRYDIDYVYNYSSKDLEMAFRVAALWAGQPGSFVVWALWGLVAAQLLIRRTRQNEPYVMSVLMLIQAGLLVFMLVRNPFVPYTENGVMLSPPDGKGLNPTLHNLWMIIHPPILFVGYALIALPFSFAIAGLWRRDYDGWVRDALPWALAAWAFLGLALLLGGYWAYETLGWGGYWGWDPVENSALVPWLTTTALIHSMLMQRTHGGLRKTNFALAVLSFVLVFYASFLTRTGVLSSFSVHSFVAEGLKTIMTSALVLIIIAGVAALAWRWRDIPSKPISEKLLSRDSFFVLSIIGLLVIAAVILLGTSMPIISGIPGIGAGLQQALGSMFQLDDGTTYGGVGTTPFQDGRFGLVGSFYTTTVPPLGLILTTLLIVGPLLGWRDTNVRAMARALRWPGAVAVVVMCASIGLVAWSGRELQPISLLYLGLVTFAAGTNLVMIIRTVRGGWMRIGGYLAHVGLMLLLAGVVGSSAYATPDQTVVIPEGQKVSALGYDYVFEGWFETPDGKGKMDLSIQQNGQEVFRAQPQLYFNNRMGATMATPAVRSELFRDLYISPVEWQPARDQNKAIMGKGETKSIGPYKITFVDFDAQMAHVDTEAKVAAQIKVEYQGQTIDASPAITLTPGEVDMSKAIQMKPVDLPGGHPIVLENVDPNQMQAIFRIDGLNLPTDPQTAVVTVSLKPGIVLVWAGVLVGVAGGLLAMVRRTLEGRAKQRGVPAAGPQGSVPGVASTFTAE
ncbi:cytochrome C biogenesis protein [Chloroflexia bacterium SDU3-3]|nr:cytochrome C biogenesis protein [Chloroflexia bacterium SDU3-3]